MAKRSSGAPGKPSTSSPRALRPPFVSPASLPPVEAGPHKPVRMSVTRTIPIAPKSEDTQDLQALFGENLRAARLKAGLKQSELAEKTGLTQQYLSLIETGRKNLTLRTMMELAKVVGQEVSVMLRRTRGRP